MKKKIMALVLAVVMCLTIVIPVFATSSLNKVASIIPGTDIEYNYVENVAVQIPGTEVTFELEGVAEFVFVESYSEWVEKTDSEGNVIYEKVTYDMPVYTFTLAEECSKATLNQEGEWLITVGNLNVGDGYGAFIDKGHTFEMPLLGEDESENRYIRNKLYFGNETYITCEGSFVTVFDSIESVVAKVEFKFLNPNYEFDEYFDETGWYYNHYLNLYQTIDISLLDVNYEESIKTGWVEDDNGWRYYNTDGTLATNKWLKDSKGWCYVGADGYCVTNTWKKDSKGWCYLDANGRMATNKWIKDSEGWCYVDGSGYCATNTWKKDSKGWVYLDANGRMVTNKWVKDSKGWCYVGANGYAVTNCWKKDSKGWCYLDENGSMTKNEWVKDGGKWYYLDGNGYMVTGTKKIGGKTYKFNSSGVWIS